MRDALANDALLLRLTEALERLAPPAPHAPDFTHADAFVWQAERMQLQPVLKVSRIPIELLIGIDNIRDQLMDNTRQFARGLPANNVLLWGARGMGKSSLVKAAHAAVNRESNTDKNAAKNTVKNAAKSPLKLIEIHREDIETLPTLMAHLRNAPYQFLLFCDDLSFDAGDSSYKSLKAVLEGGLEGRPENVLFYATSNRRHLLPRDMMENERGSAINPGEAVEEKVSLSDRFGLWLGVHKCSQDEYLEMVETYLTRIGIAFERDALHHAALEWSTTRGSRAGRVAWQFVQDYAGKAGVKAEL